MLECGKINLEIKEGYMLNRIILVGRLVADPTLRKTNDNKSIASFTLAVDERIKDTNGQKNTIFIGITTWNQQADNVVNYCVKGSLVGVDGRIHQNTYLDRNNNKKTFIEVIADNVYFLETQKEKKLKEEEEKKQAIFNDEKQDNPISDVNNDDLPF